jgi:hypothetical protein
MQKYFCVRGIFCSYRAYTCPKSGQACLQSYILCLKSLEKKDKRIPARDVTIGRDRRRD